ncbi:MAG: cupin domain-containing protein [Limnohabitans sp.]
MSQPEATPALPAHLHEFRRQALADGFEEPLLRRWAPHDVADTHTHPFDARAVLVEGHMQLIVRGQRQVLTAGDGFSLEREVPHEEIYGPQGAAYWVARRS